MGLTDVKRVTSKIDGPAVAAGVERPLPFTPRRTASVRHYSSVLAIGSGEGRGRGYGLVVGGVTRGRRTGDGGGACRWRNGSVGGDGEYTAGPL